MASTAVLDTQHQHTAAMARKQLGSLFDWAVNVQPEDIPTAAWQRAAEILFDDIAAMTAAWSEPEFLRLYPQLISQNHGDESSVFCRPGIKADIRTAALINAMSANWLELDEGYRQTPCHAGLYTLPTLLALAESDDASVKELLHCLVVAYELITRIARAFPQRTAVMQSHGRYAALGAACALALHKGFDADQLAHAASAAVTLITPSPRNHLAGGALVRNIWAGVGARNGIDAAEWAQYGTAGMASSIYDVYVTILGGYCRPDELTRGLGSNWAVMQGYTKMYACCQHLHAAVEAMLDIRHEVVSKGIEDVTGVHVETHDLALPLDEAHPLTSLAAKFSMSHAMAAALVTGRATEEAFSSVSIGDPGIDTLRRRISMSPWPGELPPSPNDRPARIRIQFKDGTAIVEECLSARGGSDRPFPKADLLDKIKRLAGDAYPGMVSVATRLTSTPALGLTGRWREALRAMSTPARENTP